MWTKVVNSLTTFVPSFFFLLSFVRSYLLFVVGVLSWSFATTLFLANYSGIANMDTGDAEGDTFFALRSVYLPVECKSQDHHHFQGFLNVFLPGVVVRILAFMGGEQEEKDERGWACKEVCLICICLSMQVTVTIQSMWVIAWRSHKFWWKLIHVLVFISLFPFVAVLGSRLIIFCFNILSLPPFSQTA